MSDFLVSLAWVLLGVGYNKEALVCTVFTANTNVSPRVRTLFWTKNSRTFQGLSRTHFPFFKDSIQCEKEPWVYVFFSSSTTWAILSWRSFCVCSRLDKNSTEIQGLSGTDYNFQGFSRSWIYILKFKDFQGACEHWGPRPFLKKNKVNPLSSKTGHMPVRKV